MDMPSVMETAAVAEAPVSRAEWGGLPFLVVFWLVAGLAGWGCLHLGAWIARLPLNARQSDGWMERARRAWAARIFINAAPMVFWAVAYGLVVSLDAELGSGLHTALRWTAGWAAWLGATWAVPVWSRRLLGRQIGWLTTLRDILAWGLLSYVPLILILVLGAHMPPSFDARALGLLAGAFAVLALWWTPLPLMLLRVLRLAVPAPATLRSAVEEAAARLGIPPAPVGLLRWSAAQAMALPWQRCLLFTEGILKACDPAQLVSVAVHELTHLQESRQVVLGLSVSTLGWLGLVMLIPLAGTFGSAGALAGILFWLAMMRLRNSLGRQMELRADRAALLHEGVPGTYASALHNLYRYNVVPAVMSGRRQTHPHLYDRMLAAGLTPSEPRPEAPLRWPGWVALGVSAGVFGFGLAFVRGLLLGG